MSSPSHSDINYFAIFGILVAAFAASLALGTLAESKTAVALIFVIAGLKATLVLSYFMHLSVEPRYIKVVVAGVIVVLAILFVGLLPDVTWVYGRPEGS